MSVNKCNAYNLGLPKFGGYKFDGYKFYDEVHSMKGNEYPFEEEVDVLQEVEFKAWSHSNTYLDNFKPS